MKMYTQDEVLQAAMKYFDNDSLAATTWINKYAMRDKEGNLVEQTPDDMHRRLAKAFATKEEHYRYKVDNKNWSKLSEYGYKREELTEEKIFNLFKDFKTLIPAGSVMSGLGTGKPVSLSNCFVLPSPLDSYSSIMITRLNQAELMKRRGGVGYDLSNLRPRGAKVNNAAVTSTGAASFMDVCSDVTNEVAQQGRRGALMLSMSILCCDVEEFIEKKQDLTKVTGANVSIQITDNFMNAVKNNEYFFLRWPITASINEDLTEKLNELKISEFEYNKLYDMIYTESDFESEAKQGYMKKIKAKDLWNKIIHCAWNTAEPGILFSDNHHNFSPDGVYDKYKGVSTNPCGEIFMSGLESCRLFAINMLSFVDNPFTDKATLNKEKIYSITYEAMRLTDDLVDLENEAVSNIINVVKDDSYALDVWNGILEKGMNGRRCGLEFTAMSDMVASLNMKFCTEESNNILKNVFKLMMTAVLDCQADMALERGTFKDINLNIEDNKWYNFIKTEYPEQYNRIKQFGRRNISFTTAGPCGSLSLLAKTSSGIEPLFMPYYTRRRKCMTSKDRVDYTDNLGVNFTEFVVVHPQLKNWAKLNIKDISDNLEELPVNEWKKIYEQSPWYGSCASDIDWEKRVILQGIVQKYFVSHSISSTINLPNNVLEDEVANIYMKAWEYGLKGITVYRDGCRAGVMVSTDNKKENDKKENPLAAKRRPKSLPCKVIRFTNKGEKWIGVVGILDGQPYEIFTGLQENLSIPNWVTDGEIVRNKENGHSRYDICYLDKEGYKVCIQGLSRISNPEYWNYGKLISGLLRHHMEIQYIIKVISSLKLDDSINAWKNGIIRTLQKFEDNHVEVKGEVCPECGGVLVREGGCIHCKDCGWTRCE